MIKSFSGVEENSFQQGVKMKKIFHLWALTCCILAFLASFKKSPEVYHMFIFFFLCLGPFVTKTYFSDRIKLAELFKAEGMMPTTRDPERFSFWVYLMLNMQVNQDKKVCSVLLIFIL